MASANLCFSYILMLATGGLSFQQTNITFTREKGSGTTPVGGHTVPREMGGNDRSNSLDQELTGIKAPSLRKLTNNYLQGRKYLYTSYILSL